VLWAVLVRRVTTAIRADDTLYVLLGVVPGAVVGGRLVHGLAFSDAYLADPASLLDLGRGSLSLLGAVLGGALSGAYVCRLLGHPVTAWADAATVPLLMAIGLGKLALVLAGGGQGAPLDAPWALAFQGPGPWLSAHPDTPAHPSQVYEGLFALAGIALCAFYLRQRSWAGSGGVFLFGLSWWVGWRGIVAFTWRDEPIFAGIIGAEQAATLLAWAAVTLTMNARAWRFRAV
jgi:prolipoprotein diacylglyceryltransferase